MKRVIVHIQPTIIGSHFIFKSLDLKYGHSGHYNTIQSAIKGLIEGWNCYQFDSYKEAFNTIALGLI